MDLNAAKYPREALFYTDIKSYEQGAGQKISTSENNLPALACLPLQQNWFWKQSFPTDKLKSPEWIVNENIIPYGKAHCNFILNVAPNRDGLMDDNALEALKEIGKRWKNNGQSIPLPDFEDPITEKNIAKNKPSESSWSWDMNIMDFANDDDFSTAWESNKYVPKPFWMVEIGKNEPVDMITITEPKGGVIQKYSLEYRSGNVWKTLFSGAATTQSRVKIHRFPTVMADAVRITIMKSNGSPAISEFGVYSSER
jgi:alpha-L-fucosidase